MNCNAALQKKNPVARPDFYEYDLN